MNPRDRRLGAAVAVAVTIAAAVVGGTAAGKVTEPSAQGTEAALGERTFVCTGGLPQGATLSGTTAGTKRDRLAELRRIKAPESDAASAFASQVARTGRTFAMGLCPEPRNDWWFVGVGASVRHSSVVTVDNPRPGTAVVNLEVFGPQGEVRAPGLQGITIGGGRSRTFELAEVAPANGDLMVHVRANRGLVSVGVSDAYSLDNGIGEQVREWVPDQFGPAREILLTGLQRRPQRASLLIANPGQAETIVEVELVGEKGPFVPQGVEKVSVPPRTVVTTDIGAAFDGKAAAVRLRAPAPVVATVRSLRAGDQSLASAGSGLSGTTVVAVPAADDRDLVLTGLAAGTVRVVAYGGRGRSLGEQQVQVEADTSRLVRLPRRARYLLLSAPPATAVAGVLVGYDGGGVAGIAVPPAARALRVPPVRPAW